MADEVSNDGAPLTSEETSRGTTLANISRRLVVLHKEFYGKGPTKARTYVQDDIVLVLMRGGYTRVEETLIRDGRIDAVQRQRDAFQQVMHDRFVAVVEEELGRKVAAFMSNSHHDPDLMAELFVLERAD
jgi:uncharacterized protein YbcI